MFVLLLIKTKKMKKIQEQILKLMLENSNDRISRQKWVENKIQIIRLKSLIK